jgi:multidrug efflux system membrane fusion protein
VKPRKNRSYFIALLIGVGAILWVFSGALLGDSGGPQMQKEAARLEAADRRPEVRVRTQRAEPHVIELVINGRTEADREVQLRSEQPGMVIELPVSKGERVEEGTLIAQLEDRDRTAAVAEARALVASRELEYNAAAQLRERGHAPETQHAATRAQLEQAQAALRRAELAQAQLSIRAPFGGILEERPVELGDLLQVGDPVGRLVDLDPLIAIATVNERDVGELELGSPGHVILASGEEREGAIRFIARTADPDTRTFRVEVAVPNGDSSLKAGMTATLRLPLREVQAHLVSPAILVLSDEGPVGVRAVNDEGVVEFHPVKILEQLPEGVWVGGLPEEVQLITVGQQYVQDGQAVTAVDEAEIADRGEGTGS